MKMMLLNSRRNWLLQAFGVVLFLGCQADVSAQNRYPIKITNVRLGLPPGPFSKARDDSTNQPLYLFKAATWAPVWVDLECTGPIDQPAIEISIDTPDGDDAMSSARIIVTPPPFGKTAGFALGRLPYLKPGGLFTDVSVNIRGVLNGKQLAEEYKQRSLTGLPPSRYLLLSVGASLPGLRLPKTESQATERTDENDPLRNGWAELAQITNVDEMPDQWFGYKAADLAVLATGSDRSFYNALANDPKRRAALREWVRRGGRLVISAGANADLLDAIPELREMMPARLAPKGKRFVDEIAMTFPNQPRMLLLPPSGGKIALQAIEAIPDRPYVEKLRSDDTANTVPLVVQAPYGLGRVTLVAFDLDTGPLVDWRFRENFWEWLLDTAGTRLPSGSEKLGSDLRYDDDEDKYLSRMQNNLEFFEGVPVISFGWVALFILAYILLIGPIEYIILKRVFKRLEWTWITFPIIVITVSAAAYFTAYELKGRDLKVNKVDIVEIDLRSNRSYGETWFTLFSPRGQNYTIGVEPIGPRSDDPSKPAWVPDGAAETLPDTLVSWHGKAKSNRQSLFRRTYSYHASMEPDASGRQPFADGLEQVPIQVWSTKSFTANWAARIDPAKPPIVSTLRISEADPNQLTGSITSFLPMETLTDAQLIYRDRVTPLPTLVRGTERFISTNSQAATASSWLQNANTQKDLGPTNRSTRHRGESEDDPTFRLWPIMFHELTTGQFGRLYNSSLREMDQSWRVGEKNLHEAILVARIGRTEGGAEEMSNSPNAPTRLWLSELPGAGPRTPMKGTLRQETYIRVYIPVLAAKK